MIKIKKKKLFLVCCHTVYIIPYYVNFVNNNSLYFNKDTAQELGYNPHLRLLRTTVEVVTTAKAPVRDFGYVLKTFDERNLTVQRKQYLVSAARRSLAIIFWIM